MNLQTIFHIWTYGTEKLNTSGHVYGKSLPVFLKKWPGIFLSNSPKRIENAYICLSSSLLKVQLKELSLLWTFIIWPFITFSFVSKKIFKLHTTTDIRKSIIRFFNQVNIQENFMTSRTKIGTRFLNFLFGFNYWTIAGGWWHPLSRKMFSSLVKYMAKMS